MEKDNAVLDKSYKFALRVIKLYKFLAEEKKEYVLSKQILRSGTSIGANVNESQAAESKLDFIHKLGISLKEARETGYWLDLLKDSEYIDENSYNSIIKDCQDLKSLIGRIIVTTKENLNKK